MLATNIAAYTLVDGKDSYLLRSNLKDALRCCSKAARHRQIPTLAT